MENANCASVSECGAGLLPRPCGPAADPLAFADERPDGEAGAAKSGNDFSFLCTQDAGDEQEALQGFMAGGSSVPKLMRAGG